MCIFLSSSLISTVLCCNTVPPGSSSAFILKCISSSKAHGHCDEKSVPTGQKPLERSSLFDDAPPGAAAPSLAGLSV